MRFVSPRNRRKLTTVEMTPMIDVVFLLIIFFMTTAQFARQTRAEVDLWGDLMETEAGKTRAVFDRDRFHAVAGTAPLRER